MTGLTYRSWDSLIPKQNDSVKAQGEVLGADGAPGLLGKRRQVSSRWARVIGRVATAPISGTGRALSRELDDRRPARRGCA